MKTSPVPEDFERTALVENIYIKADEYEEQQRIIQEINEEEHRLPAKIQVNYIPSVTEKEQTNESKSEPLPF